MAAGEPLLTRQTNIPLFTWIQIFVHISLTWIQIFVHLDTNTCVVHLNTDTFFTWLQISLLTSQQRFISPPECQHDNDNQKNLFSENVVTAFTRSPILQSIPLQRTTCLTPWDTWALTSPGLFPLMGAIMLTPLLVLMVGTDTTFYREMSENMTKRLMDATGRCNWLRCYYYCITLGWRCSV